MTKFDDSYLSDYLNSNDFSKSDNIPKNKKDKFITSRVEELQFMSLDMNLLPCKHFYPKGAQIMIRPAQVREIQAYSTVDNTNFADVVDKMNDILQNCAYIKYADGSTGTFIDIKDQDRLYLILNIRDLTFQNGTKLAIDVNCDSCGSANKLELVHNYFINHELSDRVMKYYHTETSSLIFKLKNGKTISITPPTIGIQKAFAKYVIEQNVNNKSIDLSFIKIVPFLLGHSNNITNEEINNKVEEFRKMDIQTFQFLFKIVDNIILGIKEISKSCSGCGQEVHTELVFPEGARGIFIVSDAFEDFID